MRPPSLHDRSSCVPRSRDRKKRAAVAAGAQDRRQHERELEPVRLVHHALHPLVVRPHAGLEVDPEAGREQQIAKVRREEQQQPRPGGGRTDWRARAASRGGKGSRWSIACEERDRDRYGRVVAVCRAPGMDLNAWMVAEGEQVAIEGSGTGEREPDCTEAPPESGAVAGRTWRVGGGGNGRRPCVRRFTGTPASCACPGPGSLPGQWRRAERMRPRQYGGASETRRDSNPRPPLSSKGRSIR